MIAAKKSCPGISIDRFTNLLECFSVGPDFKSHYIGHTETDSFHIESRLFCTFSDDEWKELWVGLEEIEKEISRRELIDEGTFFAVLLKRIDTLLGIKDRNRSSVFHQDGSLKGGCIRDLSKSGQKVDFPISSLINDFYSMLRSKGDRTCFPLLLPYVLFALNSSGVSFFDYLNTNGPNGTQVYLKILSASDYQKHQP
jgi:hypothetical protein